MFLLSGIFILIEVPFKTRQRFSKCSTQMLRNVAIKGTNVRIPVHFSVAQCMLIINNKCSNLRSSLVSVYPV